MKTTRTFISKLNWRQVVLHLLAAWFFVHAFKVLSNLYDVEMISILRHTPAEEQDSVMITSGKTSADLFYFSVWKSFAGLAGLLTAFTVSLVLSLRNGWSWMNSLLVLIVAWLLKLELLGPSFVYTATRHLGQVMGNDTLEFMVSGGLLLTLGLLLLLVKPSRRFINGARPGNATIEP